jgi:Na+/proline symporter
MVESNKRSSARGYTLGMLFLLIAACGVLLGLSAPILREPGSRGVGLAQILIVAIVSAVLLAILGMLLGLFHYRRVPGVLCGLVTGALLGAVFGPTIFVPPQSFPFIFSTAVGGAILIVVVGAVIRLTSAPPTPRGTADQAPIEATLIQPQPHPLDPDE